MAKTKATQVAYKADCNEAFKKLAIKPALIVADSPYNYGMNYDSYHDKKPRDKFLDWMHSWILGAYNALDKYGSFWIFAPDEWVSEVDMYCRNFCKFYRRSWIVWSFGFGVASQKNFARSHTHILYFTKHGTNFTFNADPVRVPSDRQLLYDDKRANPKGKLPNNTWVLQKDEMERVLPPEGDTWYVSRICGTFKEREKHSPNQIPVPLMQRIITSTSNPGDFVVDPFAGTGASGVACAMHGRNWIGWDISNTCVKQSNRRIFEAIRG